MKRKTPAKPRTAPQAPASEPKAPTVEQQLALAVDALRAIRNQRLQEAAALSRLLGDG